VGVKKQLKMIKTFADKYTQMLFERKRVLKWKHVEQIARRKLKTLTTLLL
jgi:hypothetical protein